MEELNWLPHQVEALCISCVLYSTLWARVMDIVGRERQKGAYHILLEEKTNE